MKIALIVGHNERSKGAYSAVLKESEYDYYKQLASIINQLDETIDIYIRKPSNSYTKEMTTVVNSINLHKYTFALELHFNNVDNTSIHGALCLAHKNSLKGQKIANLFLKMLCKKYGIANKGIINITDESQRGGFGICKTKCPYVLIEPFFGNNKEANNFLNKEEFAKFLIDFIKEACNE